MTTIEQQAADLYTQAIVERELALVVGLQSFLTANSVAILAAADAGEAFTIIEDLDADGQIFRTAMCKANHGMQSGSLHVAPDPDGVCISFEPTPTET